MTELQNPAHRERWRLEVRRIVDELKAIPDWGGKEELKVGIVLDDALVKLTIKVEVIKTVAADTLSESLYCAALEMIEAMPRGADGKISGRSQGRFEVNEAAPTEYSTVNDPTSFSVEPAAPENQPCWRRLEPDFKEACPNNAAGGVRLKLFPAEAVSKRYGKRPLLKLTLDIPVCANCGAKITAAEVITNLEAGLWGQFSKEAQRRNKGFLPIKENSEVEFVPFDDPEYVLLRQWMAKAANDGLKKQI